MSTDNDTRGGANDDAVLADTTDDANSAESARAEGAAEQHADAALEAAETDADEQTGSVTHDDAEVVEEADDAGVGGEVAGGAA